MSQSPKRLNAVSPIKTANVRTLGEAKHGWLGAAQVSRTQVGLPQQCQKQVSSDIARNNIAIAQAIAPFSLKDLDKAVGLFLVQLPFRVKGETVRGDLGSALELGRYFGIKLP